MKRNLVKLASIAIVTVGVTGTALAESNLPAAQDEDINSSPDAQNLAGCHAGTAAASATLPLEAPWVSLALLNAEPIGLAAEQVRQLEILRAEFEREAARQSSVIATAELNLRQLLAAQPVDLQRVEAKLEEIGALRATLRLRRIETVLAGRDLLSLQQQERLQEVATSAATEMHRAMMQSIHGAQAPAPSAKVM